MHAVPWGNKSRGLLIFLCLAMAQGIFAQARQKPNLLFIMTDQQCSDALSIAGNTVLETPNLDRLVRQGAFFGNAYTPCAVCAPARSSILTGHTVEHTGAKTNAKSYNVKEEGLMTMPTFDEILAGQGYHCEYYMIVKDGWKLMISYSKTSKVINAMYDLNTDPHEMNNLLGTPATKRQYTENAEELRQCLLEWLKKNLSKHIQGVKERELI